MNLCGILFVSLRSSILINESVGNTAYRSVLLYLLGEVGA